MLRMLLYGALVLALCAFGFVGLEGWLRPQAASEGRQLFADEVPLRKGGLVGSGLVGYGLKGFPFESLRVETIEARRDLPPDPAPLADEDQLKHNERTATGMRFKLKEGDYSWAALKKAIPPCTAPFGLTTYFPAPQPPDSLMVSIPRITLEHGEWEGFTLFSLLRSMTQDQVQAVVTAEGIAVATPEGCNRARDAAMLIGLRRRVAAGNAAPQLRTAVRPDVLDASVLAFCRTIEAQSGIPVVLEARIWEQGPALSWRGEPRPLAALLDELTRAFGWFWRFKDGRIYILAP